VGRLELECTVRTLRRSWVVVADRGGQ
jgi:hypothetical protein